MLDVLVIGGGIAGATCAARCAAAGLEVRLVDRGRRLGGRFATRTLRSGGEQRGVDTAVGSFAVGGGDFRTAVDDWEHAGVVRRLTVSDGEPARFAGIRGARSVVESMLSGIATSVEHTVGPLGADGRVAGLPSRAVVLAMPGPQAERLLTALPHLAALCSQPYASALTLAAWFPRRTWAPLAVRTTGDAEVDRIVDDGLARGDEAPVLVARCSPAFAALHLANPHTAAPSMLAAVQRSVGVVDEPLAVHLQRWTFAQPTSASARTHHLGDELVGLCGDGWSAGGDADGAWRSGHELAEALIKAL